MAVSNQSSILWKHIDISHWAKAILADNRSALSQAITLVESQSYEDRLLAIELFKKLNELSGTKKTQKSLRLAISGVAGSGKSTLIEKIGLQWIAANHKVSVSSVDPSSVITKGSLLADKTRMQKLSKSRFAFIRPTPSGGLTGGLARRTREVISLLEFAGFSRIIIETMGSGQSEVDCADMVDHMIVLVLSGSGDLLQAMKKGLYEHADTLVVSKADDPQDPKIKSAMSYLNGSFYQKIIDKKKFVFSVSCFDKKRITALVNHMDTLYQSNYSSGYLIKKRSNQMLKWYDEEYNQTVIEHIKLSKAFINIKSSYKSNLCNSDNCQPALLAWQAANDYLKLGANHKDKKRL